MKKTLVVYYILALILVAGFATNVSDNPQVLNYSMKYFIFLMILVLIFLVAIPWWMNRFIGKHGTRKFFMAILPSLVTIALIYIGGHFYYYATQTHLFDPFMQMPPNAYEYDIQKDSTELRVLCLGGSTTRNVRLDTMERYPSVLHQKLKEKFPSRDVKLINAGMDWYTSKHSTMNYTLYCRDFQPDVVVLMHAVNDLYRSFSPKKLAVGEYESDYSHFYGPSIAGAMPPSFEGFMGSILRKVWFAPKYDPAEIDIAQFKSLNDFSKYMNSLVEILENDGAEVVLVSQPYLYKTEMSKEEEKTLWMDRGMCLLDGKFPNGSSMANAMDAYNSATKAIATKNNVTFVDGEKALPKDLDHFVDDVHYTTVGAEKLAEAVANGITSN